MIIQYVRTSWTKVSRGGPEAARRNRSPIAFRLPQRQPPFVHRVVMTEVGGFQPEEVVYTWPLPPDVPLPDAHWLRLLKVRPGRDGLRVELRDDLWSAPERRRRPPGVHLAANVWVRWRINHRYSGGTRGGAWRYCTDTVSVLNGVGAPDVFLGQPTKVVDERAMLR